MMRCDFCAFLTNSAQSRAAGWNELGGGEAVVLLGDVLFIKVNVSLSHTQIRMPHKVLQTEQVSTVLEKECCKAVTELIRGQFDAAILAMVSKRLVELRDG